MRRVPWLMVHILSLSYDDPAVKDKQQVIRPDLLWSQYRGNFYFKSKALCKFEQVYILPHIFELSFDIPYKLLKLKT